MAEKDQVQTAMAQMHGNMDSGIDYAVRVANDVASTMQAVLHASSKVTKPQDGGKAQAIMANSIDFTNASIADFLNVSKVLLRVQSPQEYYEIQSNFFRDRASATRDHIKLLSDTIMPESS